MKTEKSAVSAETSLQKNKSHMYELSQEEKDNLKMKPEVNEDVEVRCQSEPIVEVIFRDKGVDEKYRLTIDKFLNELLSKEETFCISLKALGEISQKNANQINGDFFRIDKSCVEMENGVPVSDDIPFYSSAYVEYLHHDDDGSKIICKAVPQSAGNERCFNCLEAHHLKDCPERLNSARIAKNRKNLRSYLNTSRYHEDEECRGKCQPGNISPGLRDALDLKPNQLPRYIYNMRVIGYPPGWLKESEIETSGLNLYGSDGKAVEDGKLNESPCGTVEYDTDKFIEYPGFNSPLPPGFVDECVVLGLPSLQDHHQLEKARKTFHSKMSSIYKRSRNSLSAFTDVERKITDKITHQGSISSFSSIATSTPRSAKCQTPTEESLEIFSPSSNRTSPASTSELRNSISCTPGTAIVDSGNPFKKLPDVSKFSVGITEHLPYENLPDSTGTFEKIRGVLDTVRRKLKESLPA